MEYYNNIYYPDYLMHYGVKGMKWGHRRYTNADGSLNAKGIKKYARAGYAQDSYNSNKTKLGKAYDKLTDAHKYAGDAMYGASSAKANKARAEKYVADKEAAKAAKNTPEAKAARRKEALKIGAAVAGTALTSYGVYKVSQAIKDKNFKHAMNNGMRALDGAASRGRLDDGMEMLKETMDMHYNAKVSDIVKRNIANNSVNGKVDWDAIRKIYK